MQPKYRAPVVKKTFQILRLLARHEHGLTLSELSRALSIGKSTVYGIAAALEEAGALVRDPTSMRYSLGLALFELGQVVASRFDLVGAARAPMEELMAKSSETVFLGTRAGDYVTILETVESNSDLKITAPVGTRLPLLAGATGKVFLASMPDDDASRLVHSKRLKRYTDNSITEPERYLDAIRTARKDGFALDDEEYISGVRAVASPIRNGGNRMAAVWVVGFTPGMGVEKMKRIAKACKLAAEEIGLRVGRESR